MVKIGSYKYNWDFFKKESEELYYFLGFVAADGYINEEGIEIGISEKDVALLERFRDLIVPNKPLYRRKRTNSYTLKISCRSQTKELKKFYGMQSNKKCYEITFPEIPSKHIKDFVRGYLDGDGCIDSTKGYRKEKIYVGPRVRLLGNEEFLSGLNSAIKTFVPNKTNAIEKKGSENIHTVTYNFSTASKILKWLYDNCSIYLERKKQKAIDVIQDGYTIR